MKKPPCYRLHAAGAIATILFAATGADAQTLSLQQFAVGLDQPLFMTAPAGDSRLFVVEKEGTIRIVENGAVQASPFLDLSKRVSTSGERGLLGLAFDPNYANNGRFYVDYVDKKSLKTVVARYTVSKDPDRARARSAQRIISIAQPGGQSNHKGGWIGFRPGEGSDLYIATGDGGGSNDPGNRAQNLKSVLGKILRVDVSGRGVGYSIPSGNPFVGGVGRDEIWAYGLRNPFRNSFDRQTGDFYIGDVGQDTREEVDFEKAPRQGGRNYGWRPREGTGDNPVVTDGPPPGAIDPIFDYTHASQQSGSGSIIGGYVYRGAAISGLQGTYFYGDFVNGTIGSFVYNGTTVTALTDRTTELNSKTLIGAFGLSSFGEDGLGELYVSDIDGTIYKIVRASSGVAAVRTSIASAIPTVSSGLNLNVQGLLILTNTLQGDLTKTGPGALLLNGTLVGNAQVLAGLFGGNATITGHLTNSGTVSPGNSPGTMSVRGNYTQTTSGTLRIEIGGRKLGEFDRMLIGGGAKLDGTLELVRENGFKLKRGDRIEFLTADQGVDGEFAQVSNSFRSGTILEPTVVYYDKSVALEMVQGSFAEFAVRRELTPNQRAVAKTLDSAAFDKKAGKLIAYLDDRTLEKLPGDFDKMAPEELTSIFTISTALATVQLVNVQRRTDDLRSGASGFSASGLAMIGTGPGYSGRLFGGAAGPSGKESKDSKGMFCPMVLDQRWGAFLTGVGEWVDVGGDGNARGYDITTGGFTLGLDYEVCPNFAVGVMAGYAGTGTDLVDDGSVWVNGGKLGLYATTFNGGWYADVAVNGGYNSYDTKRGALQGTARGSTDGGELNVLVGTGYDWKIGGLQIGPTATFNYTLVGIDEYTEHGSLAPLNIGDRDTESLRTAVGFKASYDWKVGGVFIKPELRAAWQHEYGESSYGIDATLANGAGNGFLVNGPKIGRDSLLLGAGFAIQCSERCSTYFYYDGELGRDSYDSHSVSGGLRLSF